MVVAVSCATDSGKELLALKKMADESYAAGDWEGSREKYERIAKRAPQDAQTWFRLGNIFARENKLEKAIACYERSAALEPRFAPAWRNLGVMRLYQAELALRASQAVTKEGHPLREGNQRIIDSIKTAIENGKSDGGGK